MSSKLKIVFMINNLYGGGAEKVLQTLLGQLDQNVYDITLYGVKNEKYDTALYPEGIQYKSIFSGGYEGGGSLKSPILIKIVNKIKQFVYNTFSAKVFYKLFVKGVYDVEVAFIEGFSTKIISGSTNPNSKKISWAHIDLEANHWSKIAYKSLQQEIESYKKFDTIVCVSDSVKTTFARKFTVSDTLKVCYNPMDVQDILKKSSVPIAISKSHNFLISAMGRLEDQKGFDRLIMCIKRLVDKNYSIELWIIGKGNDKNKLSQFIEDHQLQDHVKLLGFQDNPYKFLKQSDLFVCSSRSEGFSLVIGEAFILEIPVVSTNCSGPDELLANGKYGILVENSEEGIYNGLMDVFENPETLEKLRDKSKERAGFFSLEQSCEHIETLWK